MRIIQILDLLLLTVLLSGCWTLSDKGVPPGQLGNTDLLGSLIGQKSESVIRELGVPNELLSDGDKKFMIYSAQSTGTGVLMIVWMPVWAEKDLANILHCLRIELDSDNLVKNYRVKSKAMDMLVLFNDVELNSNCREVFWSKRELKKLEKTRDFAPERFENLRQKEGGINQQWWWNLEYELRRQAKQGNSEAQLNIFKNLSKKQPEVALVWLCRSADSGNQEARVILKNIYEHGGDPWIKKGIVERDFRLAYVWHELSGVDLYSSQAYLNYIASEVGQDAIKMLREWQPGDCERELGLDGDELSNIN